ncbi:MAG: AraC family transcriptional regulator [Epsilonproteobacteria bacterium]|nr:AraC family transcriptional regulator [Campylobacterota bacterium]
MSDISILEQFQPYYNADYIVNNSFERNINNDIFFIKNQLSLQEDIRYTAQIPISGLAFYYKQNNIKPICQNLSHKNQLCIYTLNYDKTDSLLTKGEIKDSSISLEKDFLLKNLPEGKSKENIIEHLETNKPTELLTKKDINPQIQLILNNIYHNPFNNQLDELYAQSKILEIISLEIQSLIDIEPNKTNKLKLDDYDIEAIKKAKEILIKNMQNPPSILELSRQVSLNEFKLKCGFKKVFNDTPYNILLHHKLEYAVELLKSSDMSIGEIATLIGYKSLSSFSKAFTKKHGLRPIDLLKSRKYYY